SARWRTACRRRRCTNRRRGEAWRACLAARAVVVPPQARGRRGSGCSLFFPRTPLVPPEAGGLVLALGSPPKRGYARLSRATRGNERSFGVGSSHFKLRQYRTAHQRRLRTRLRSSAITLRRGGASGRSRSGASGRSLGSFSAIPNSCSRRSISIHTSLGWIPEATQSTTRL